MCFGVRDDDVDANPRAAASRRAEAAPTSLRSIPVVSYPRLASRTALRPCPSPMSIARRRWCRDGGAFSVAAMPGGIARNALGREIKSFFALYAASYFDADELRDFAGDAWLALMLCQIIPAAITGTIAAAGVARMHSPQATFCLILHLHAVWWRASAMRKHLATPPIYSAFCVQSACRIAQVRRLLASVSINADQVVRTVTDDMLGVNLAWWDFPLNNSPTQTANLTAAAGFTGFRFPGGATRMNFT